MSTMSVQSPKTATDSAIGKLAASRLKVVKELSLDGWSELTDVGLKVRKKIQFFDPSFLSRKIWRVAWRNGLINLRD